MRGPPSEIDEAVPPQFAGARPVWQSRLADGRRVLLIARVVPLNQENQEHIARLRGAHGPKFTFAGGSPESPSVELSEVVWSDTGSNVILIVPAGSETIRKLGKPASREAAAKHRRQPEVDCVCPDASIDLVAPNGARVGVLVLQGRKDSITLSKNEHVVVALGHFRFTRIDENIMPGQSFELRPLSVSAIPTIAGLRPREWNYSVSCAYDGKNLFVTIRPLSAALLAVESKSHSDLQGHEQVIITAPPSELTRVPRRVSRE